MWQFVSDSTPDTLTDLYRENYPFFIEGQHFDPEDPGYSQMMVEYIRQVTELPSFELFRASEVSGDVTSNRIIFEGHSLNIFFQSRVGLHRWVITIGKIDERGTTFSGNDLREIWQEVQSMVSSNQDSE